MAEIKISVDRDGNVEIDGEGFKGKACQEALERYLRALGGQSAKIIKKPEFNQAEKVKTKQERR